MGINDRNKIALILALYSENRQNSTANSSFIDKFLPSLVEYAKQFSHFEFTLYLGIDNEHLLNVDQVLNTKLKATFLEISSKINLRFKMYVNKSRTDETIEFWNELSKSAFDDGSDYFFKVSEDVTFPTNDWLEQYIQVLRSHPIHDGFGIIFPECPLGKLHQHLFLSRTHFEICGSLYPPPVPLCYSGRWISEMYKELESIYYVPSLNYSPDFVPEPREQPKQLDLWIKSVVEYLIVHAVENMKRWVLSIARTRRGRVEIPSSREKNSIHLITQYYEPSDPEHCEEIKTCLKKNLANPLISVIHLLTESAYDLKKIVGVMVSERIRQVVIGKRLTYRGAFNYARENLSNSICIVSNSDIYFDDSLRAVENLDLTGKVLALTRYDVLEDGTRELFSLPGPSCKPHIGSQDAWIFLSPIPDMDCDFELGQPRCDGRIAYIIDENDLEIINPCNTIHAMHLHRSIARKYDKGKRLEPPFLYVQHCEIFQSSEKSIPISELKQPASISTIATENALESLRLLLGSILIFAPNIPVILFADTAVGGAIRKEFPMLNIEVSVLLDRYSGKNRKEMVEEGTWSRFMLEKCSAIDAGLTRYPDTLYVDSDVIFLDDLPRVDFRKDIYLSPHGIKSEAVERYGEFNGGFLWVRNREFSKWWREETTRETKFFEQYSLNSASNVFNTGIFPCQVNFGWWRLILSERPVLGFNQFKIGKDGRIRFQNKPLQSVHTNFSSEESMVKEFNNFFMSIIKATKEPRLMVLRECMVG